ncbi:hypothetical protein [Nostoc sp. NZL]|uniref:hypothetical protein n=1 Tax=Nostoc sp. NZL TaxID=2650612 RepID=UPI001E2A006C|nr:hypothetical protein [Nostoc sp. NZL]
MTWYIFFCDLLPKSHLVKESLEFNTLGLRLNSLSTKVNFLTNRKGRKGRKGREEREEREERNA